MEKRTKNLLKVGLLLAAGTAVASKNKAVKIGAGAVALAGGIYFGKELFKKHLGEVNQECDETEEIIEKSGVNPETLESDSLLVPEKEDENSGAINTKTLYRQARDKFDDEILESWKFNERTVHVLQDDKRLVFALQMPKYQERDGDSRKIGSAKLTGFSMYKYFKEEFLDLAVQDELAINPREINIYQKGYAKVIRENYTCFDEIPRLDNEKTNDYVKRVNSIIETWETVEGFRKKTIEEYEEKGEEIKGYAIFMFIEFPVRKEGEIVPGMTVTKTMWLLDELLGTQYDIPVNAQGITTPFDFQHTLFHPGNDLTEFYTWDPEERVIEVMYL